MLAVAAFAIWGNRTSASNQSAPTQTTGQAAICGQPGTPAPSVTGATSVRWERVSGYALPISQTDGPAKRASSGVWSCYADTPSGAVLAGWIISMRVQGVATDWQTVVRQQTVAGAGQDARLAEGLKAMTSVEPKGFSVSAYAPERATVAYYEHTGQGDFTCTLDVRWVDDDWKLVLGDDGSTATSCVQQVPAHFTPWGP